LREPPRATHFVRAAGSPPGSKGARGARARALLLALAAVASFAWVASDLGLEHFGLPSDEAFYHQAAKRHAAWLANLGAPGQLSAESLRAHFAWRPDVIVHPTFSRWLSAASWRLFHGELGLDEIAAHRLHNAFAYALVALGITGFCTRRWGVAVGAVALLIFWSDTRFFGHAHTAMTDATLSCLWLWAVLLSIRANEGGRRGSVLAVALLSGLALATKLTGLALCALLAAWPLVARGRAAWRSTLLLLLVPPIVFFAINPQTWHQPLGWWIDFVAGFREREAANFIPTLFLGRRYGHRVPGYVPWVHALLTTPPTILLLSLLAAWRGATSLVRASAAQRADWLRGPWPLLIAAGLLPIALASLPGIPAHDLERLFLPSRPFFILYAACGFSAALRAPLFARLARALPGEPAHGLPGGPARLGVAVLAAIVCVPPLIEAARQHPYPLTYFNGLVGGMRGAERLGFDVAYLKLEANRGVLEALNRELPADTTLYANFLNLDLGQHQRAGRLRSDLRVTRDPRADFAIIHNRRGWMTFFEARLWNAESAPVWRLRHRGVDLVRIYRIGAERP
jgi:hypothetical protein